MQRAFRKIAVRPDLDFRDKIRDFNISRDILYCFPEFRPGFFRPVSLIQVFPDMP